MKTFIFILIFIKSTHGDNSNTNKQEASERVSSSALTNSDASYWQKKRETDLRSVYVGQIDYSVTPEELATLMGVAGVVNRVTLLTDKWTGYPKGSGYVEYESLLSASKALKLNQVVYRGRFLRIEQKRTNVPWFIASRYGGYDAIPFGLNGRVAGATRQGLQARAWFTHTVGQNRFVPYSKPQPAGKAA